MGMPWKPTFSMGMQRQALFSMGMPWKPTFSMGMQRQALFSMDMPWKPTFSMGMPWHARSKQWGTCHGMSIQKIKILSHEKNYFTQPVVTTLSGHCREFLLQRTNHARI
jgi:hypothetical protein